MNTRQVNTRNELDARGDLELLTDAMVEIEIDEDGVAWIDVLDVECSFGSRIKQPDGTRKRASGWLVNAPGYGGVVYDDLAEAMRKAIAAGLDDDDPETSLLKWVFEPPPEKKPRDQENKDSG